MIGVYEGEAQMVTMVTGGWSFDQYMSSCRAMWLILLLLPKLSVTLPINNNNSADVIFEGQAIANITQYTTTFLLLKVYRGAQFLINDNNITEKYVQVQGWAEPPNEVIQPGTTSIVHCDAQLEDCRAVTWSRDAEAKLWDSFGWSQWSAWTPCSVTCGTGGTQGRRRTCEKEHCIGHALESRHCNFFTCAGAVSPLMIPGPHEQFHPAQRLWQRPPERPSAWRLRPDAYVWVPSAQLFPSTGAFPQSFTVLMTIRVLEQEEGARGALFSLSSRRQPDAYLSLELAGNGLRLVNSNHGISRSVAIPAQIADRNWHWLAVSVRDHSAVTAYMDCTWLTTEVLPHYSLDRPQDADLVVGYLFQGDLEQLLVSSDPEAVSQQCSHTHVAPLSRQTTPTAVPQTSVDYSKPYDIEWTAWSVCNASCNNIGIQTRHSRCIDSPTPSGLELCVESGGEVTQSRECMVACQHCHCLNGGICHKKHHCHCPPEFAGRKCQVPRNVLHNCSCLHGTCVNAKCVCNKNYTGVKCDVRTDLGRFCEDECMNGGSCLDGQCFCTQGFSGPTCSKPRCDTPCENGGICLGQDRCLCTSQYTGAYCETRLCPQTGRRLKRQLFLPKFTPLVPTACP